MGGTFCFGGLAMFSSSILTLILASAVSHLELVEL